MTGTAKRFRRGTHRSLEPEETLERVRPLMGPLEITRLSNVTGLDLVGIPVAIACRPNARSNAVSQGKGLDLAAAKASALMEAIETACAERILALARLARLPICNASTSWLTGPAFRGPQAAGPSMSARPSRGSRGATYLPVARPGCRSKA